MGSVGGHKTKKVGSPPKTSGSESISSKGLISHTPVNEMEHSRGPRNFQPIPSMLKTKRNMMFIKNDKKNTLSSIFGGRWHKNMI